MILNTSIWTLLLSRLWKVLRTGGHCFFLFCPLFGREEILGFGWVIEVGRWFFLGVLGDNREILGFGWEFRMEKWCCLRVVGDNREHRCVLKYRKITNSIQLPFNIERSRFINHLSLAHTYECIFLCEQVICCENKP